MIRRFGFPVTDMRRGLHRRLTASVSFLSLWGGVNDWASNNLSPFYKLVQEAQGSRVSY